MGGRAVGGCESPGPWRLGWGAEFGAFEGVFRGSAELSPFRPASLSLLGFPLKKQDICSAKGNLRFYYRRKRQASPSERVDNCGSCHRVQPGCVGSKPEINVALCRGHRGRLVTGGRPAPLAPQGENSTGASRLPRARCQGRRRGAGGPRLPGTAHMKASVGV